MDCVTAINEAIAEASSPEAALEAYIKENLRIAAAEEHCWMMGLAEGISGPMGTDIASAHHELRRRLRSYIPSHRVAGMLEKMASKQIVMVALTLVVMVVVSMTLLKSEFSVAGLWEPSQHQVRRVELQPFRGWSYQEWWRPWVDSFGNVALFVPWGYLLTLLGWRLRWPVVVATLASISLSAGIETLQFIFARGYSDIDDVVFNSLGGLLGALVVSRSSWASSGRAVLVFSVLSVIVLSVFGMSALPA
ncbi:VanZ family protein [Corynebacterium diphtheriae]|uniref:VanZ family protein n=1 Tax=Corynebacterium diphtheriae TaxID=1717 RepID=UPI003F8D6103